MSEDHETSIISASKSLRPRHAKTLRRLIEISWNLSGLTSLQFFSLLLGFTFLSMNFVTSHVYLLDSRECALNVLMLLVSFP